jgi:hypothetical protein
MSDLLSRAVRIFGTNGDGDADWPYGLHTPHRGYNAADRAEYIAELPGQRAKQELIVDWADGHGLKRSVGCCPVWLRKDFSRSCNGTRNGSGACTQHDEGHGIWRWLEHPIGWNKDGRPAALTSSPYRLTAGDKDRLDWWTAQDERLRYVIGDGWYGCGSQQVVLYRADRIDRVDPVLLTS